MPFFPARYFAPRFFAQRYFDSVEIELPDLLGPGVVSGESMSLTSIAEEAIRFGIVTSEGLAIATVHGEGLSL